MVSQLQNIGNILAYLCEHGPSTQYALRKTKKVGSERKLPDHMERLKNAGYVKVDSRGKWSVSESGVVLYLLICAQIGKSRLGINVNFSNLASTNFLPSIFARWAKFREQKVDDIAERMLSLLVLYVVGRVTDSAHIESVWNSLGRLSCDSERVSLIERGFFGLDNWMYELEMTGKDRRRWFNALSKDRDLGKPFVDYLKSEQYMAPADPRKISTQELKQISREILIETLTSDPQLEKDRKEFDEFQRKISEKQERKLRKYSSGDYTWFKKTIKVTGQEEGTCIFFDNPSLKIKGAGSFRAPEGLIEFRKDIDCSTTKFQRRRERWVTTVPVTCSDEIFVTGLALQGIELTRDLKVSWKGNLNATTPNLRITENSDATVYKNFSKDYGILNVKATRHSACGNNGQFIENKDSAGTPEAFASR